MGKQIIIIYFGSGCSWEHLEPNVASPLITIIYCFYLFNVFWLIEMFTISFTDYNVIVKCFLSDSFIEYIILLLKLFVNIIFCK